MDFLVKEHRERLLQQAKILNDLRIRRIDSSKMFIQQSNVLRNFHLQPEPTGKLIFSRYNLMQPQDNLPA